MRSSRVEILKIIGRVGQSTDESEKVEKLGGRPVFASISASLIRDVQNALKCLGIKRNIFPHLASNFDATSEIFNLFTQFLAIQFDVLITETLIYFV